MQKPYAPFCRFTYKPITDKVPIFNCHKTPVPPGGRAGSAQTRATP